MSNECDLSEDNIYMYYGKEISGKQFNKLSKDIELVKLTNCNEIHNTFEYKTGLNVDTLKFNPHGTCSSGGLYFCTIQNAFRWVFYSNKLFTPLTMMMYIRSVTIPDDASVYVESDKIKADKIILGERKQISVDMYLKFIDILKNDCENLKSFTKTLSAMTILQRENNMIFKNMYLKIVNIYGSLLLYVPVDMVDYEMCMVAIKLDSNALRYIPDSIEKNKQFYTDAAKQNLNVFWIMPQEFMDKELCMRVVKGSMYALSYVPEKFKDEEVCLCSVKNHAITIRNVPEHLRTFELCSVAMKAATIDIKKYIPRSIIHLFP